MVRPGEPSGGRLEASLGPGAWCGGQAVSRALREEGLGLAGSGAPGLFGFKCSSPSPFIFIFTGQRIKLRAYTMLGKRNSCAQPTSVFFVVYAMVVTPGTGFGNQAR